MGKRQELINKLTIAYVTNGHAFTTWPEFLQSVGICFNEKVESGYVVVDANKWVCARLKYGI